MYIHTSMYLICIYDGRLCRRLVLLKFWELGMRQDSKEVRRGP